MALIKQTSKQYFSGLRILHMAFFAGLILFSAVSFFLVFTGSMGKNSELNGILTILVPGLLVAGIISSYFIAKNRLSTLVDKNLNEKLSGYRVVMILKIALLEGPALFAIISYLLTGNNLCLGLAMLAVLLILFINPSREKVAEELNLSTQDRALIANDDAHVTEIEAQ
ncbi:MAG: hypothetical protein IPH58_13080 [Sphingobacteriales bacterium]|nr:hypothetical protein [Sphingobacteriales bacterium]